MQTLYEMPIFYFKLNHVKSIPVVKFFLFNTWTTTTNAHIYGAMNFFLNYN